MPLSPQQRTELLGISFWLGLVKQPLVRLLETRAGIGDV